MKVTKGTEMKTPRALLYRSAEMFMNQGVLIIAVSGIGRDMQRTSKVLM